VEGGDVRHARTATGWSLGSKIDGEDGQFFGSLLGEGLEDEGEREFRLFKDVCCGRHKRKRESGKFGGRVSLVDGGEVCLGGGRAETVVPCAEGCRSP
jgi:hypothetical protein